MILPAARGPISTAVIDALAGRTPSGELEVSSLVTEVADPVTDEDLQLALWALYETSYLGFSDALEDAEWQPDLVRARGVLEACFEGELRRRTADRVAESMNAPGDVAEQLFTLTETFEGPSLARYLHREATLEQFLEFLQQRSVYHLKESDPASFALARLTGKPKVALAELLYDEYGGGRAERLHSTMFGDSLEAAGLGREYGAYLDLVPGYTLAVNNAMSLFGLQRRLRGAAMGHLGAFEATSSIPCRKIAAGIRRLGLGDGVAAYFDEHVEADAVHEQLALRYICAEMIEQDPELREDVFFGATVCLHLDTVAAERMLAAWATGTSALRGGMEAVA